MKSRNFVLLLLLPALLLVIYIFPYKYWSGKNVRVSSTAEERAGNGYVNLGLDSGEGTLVNLVSSTAEELAGNGYVNLGLDSGEGTLVNL